MRIRARKDVVKGIREFKKKLDGKEYPYFEAYLGTGADGRKIRFSKPTRVELLAVVNEFYAVRREHGDSAVAVLSPYQAHDARAAFDILSRAGIKNVSLAECARKYADDAALCWGGGTKPLKDAFEEYAASRPDWSEPQRMQVKARVGKWVATFNAEKKCGEVTMADVEAYLSGKQDCVTTYNNILGYIKTFLAWCAKPGRRYMRESPAVSMERRIKPYKRPEFMGADDVEAVSRILEQDGDAPVICYFALSFLAGMRVAEIRRMADFPKDFNLEDGTIFVEKPKGRTSPRLIHLCGNALEWLKAYDVRASITRLPVVPDKKIKHLVRKARPDIIIPKNAGRHTFITMHYGAYCNPSLTAALCGTSPGIMAKHYNGIATRTEGLRYLGIMPSAGRKPLAV